MHSSLTCAMCGTDHAVDQLQNLCTECQKPLLAHYDLDAIKSTFTPDAVRKRTIRSMWKFWDVLPVNDPSEAVSLGEGLTPLLTCNRTGPFEAFDNLFIKDESFNPTGSFKARGMSAAVTRAKALGVETVALPSAGNAAGAATYYSARAGMGCAIFMPEDTPPANIIESVVGNANVNLVNGLISDCGKLVKQGKDRFSWFDLSTLKEPFRIEGKKTMGYELAFDFADHAGTTELQLPDVILYPTGGGTGLIGMWKAFDELAQLGWLETAARPKLYSCQSDGCAPIARAFAAGERFADPVENASTCASGLRVPKAVGDFMILDAVRESGGAAHAAPEEELVPWMQRANELEGISLCPETAACLVVLAGLTARGELAADAEVVVYNTGAAQKYVELLAVDAPTLAPDEDVDWEALAASPG